MSNGKITGPGSPPPQIDSTNEVESVQTETNSTPAPVTLDDKAPPAELPAHDGPKGKIGELMFGGLAHAAAMPKLTTEEFTKMRTDLKNDPNFKKLTPTMQKDIADYFDVLIDDPKAMDNLSQIATDPNFSKLSETQQRAVLARFADSMDSPANIKSIKSEMKDRVAIEENPNFQKLDPATKKQVSELLDKFSLQPDARAQLMRIVTSPDLKNLSAARQADVLNAFMKAPADATATGTLQEIMQGLTRPGVDDATQARVLNLAAKEAGHPKFTNDLATLVKDTRFAMLPAEDKGKMLNVFQASSPDGRTALLSIMQHQGVPPYSSLQSILTQLDRLQSSNILPIITDKTGKTSGKQQVMEDLMKELANPDQNINQSSKGTCTCTSMSFGLAKNRPAEYARLMTDLLTTGKTKLANGDTISPPGDAYAFDGTSRSEGERLLQSSLMNYATGGTYMNSADISVQNNFQGGLYPNQELKVLQALNGKDYTKISGPSIGNPMRMLTETAKALSDGKAPVLADLRWSKNSGHAVEVMKIANGKVYFRNPWGGHIPGVSNGVGPTGSKPGSGPSRNVEDGPNGLESMPLDDYLKLVTSIYVED